MFLALAILLVLGWIAGFGVFHVASAAIHLLIILAVGSLIVHVIAGRKT